MANDNLTQGGGQPIVQPEDALGKRIDALESKITSTTRELKDDARDQKNYLFLGAFILIIMVATIIVMILLSWVDSVDSLQQRIDNVQLNQANGTSVIPQE